MGTHPIFESDFDCLTERWDPSHCPNGRSLPSRNAPDCSRAPSPTKILKSSWNLNPVKRDKSSRNFSKRLTRQQTQSLLKWKFLKVGPTFFHNGNFNRVPFPQSQTAALFRIRNLRMLQCTNRLHHRWVNQQ